MNIQSWLRKASEKLANANIATNTLDAQVLLADLLGVDKSWLHAHPEHKLTLTQLKLLDAQIERRKQHEPLAYIRGKQEFYGRDFLVSPDTLTPRPETETMIEMVLSSELIAHSEQPIHFIDVGTGSGCIIITLALELARILELRSQIFDGEQTLVNGHSEIHFYGVDISKPALKIAQKNAENLQAPVTFNHFDLCKDPLYSLLAPHSSLVILANLPYVPENFHINLAASHEPPFAIFGGKDGLDYYRLLFQQLSQESSNFAAPPRSKVQDSRSITVFTESLPPQHEALKQIAEANGFALQRTQDFIQHFEKSPS